MIRLAILVAAVTLEGCGPVPLYAPQKAPNVACPVNHTASCDVLPGKRQPDAASCSCVRNIDLNRMFRRL